MKTFLRSKLVLALAALIMIAATTVIPLADSNLHPQAAHADSSGWTILPSPSIASAYNSLSGVTGTSLSDAWAVGGSSANNNWSQLIIHWNGSQWSLNSFADNTDPVSYLIGVAAISQTDVWAVGYGGSQSNPYVSGTHPLVEHYLNGIWSIVTTPTLNGSLWGVAAVSSSDVWAVGYDVDTNNELIEHWDGSSWSVIPPPVRTTSGALLHSVTVVSATNIWAVGTNNWYGRDGQALADYWDGTSWTAKDPPGLTDGNGTVLESASANPSTGVVWAAGTTYINGTNSDPQIIGYFANGVWNSVQDTVNNQNYSYNALAASASEVDVMTYQTTAEKYISGNWQSVSVQGSLSGSHLWGMNVIPGVNVFWAVGDDGSGNTLTEQYSPTLPPPTTTWGVDSFNPITSSSYSSVQKALGTPDFWGRYIGLGAFADDMKASEVTFAHSKGLAILLVYSDYNPANVKGYTTGQTYAITAIKAAQRVLNISQGVAIFVDIEAGETPDAAFLQGWYDRLNSTFTYSYKGIQYTYQAGYYKAGYYGNTGSTNPFTLAYCQAVSSEGQIGTNAFVWTTQPNPGRTTKAAAPAFAPIQPSCANQTFAWQYGLAGSQPPNVDTDEIGGILPLWHP